MIVPGSLNAMMLGGLHPFTTAYIKAWSSQPTSVEVGKINSFITRMVALGLWSKFDALYFLKASDNQGSRVNIVDPSNIASVVGSPTFSAGNGWVTAANTNYLDSGLVMNALSAFQQNSAHMSAESDQNSIRNSEDIGSLSGSTAYLRLQASSGQTYGGINQLAGASQPATAGTLPSATSIGHTLINRIAASGTDAIRQYKDGNRITATNNNQASVALPAANFVMLRSWSGYGGHRLRFVSLGGGLTDGEVSNFYSALNDLMQ